MFSPVVCEIGVLNTEDDLPLQAEAGVAPASVRYDTEFFFSEYFPLRKESLKMHIVQLFTGS